MTAVRKFVIILFLVLGVSAIFLAGVLLDFTFRAQRYDGSNVLPRIAIVFGGSHDRLYLAMDLLDRGLVDQVYITGANRAGGIRTDTFAEDYDLPPNARRRLEAGQVVFAPKATNTLENAVETSCWLRDHPDITSITLITSRWHMPRASLSLERALRRNVAIVRFASEPQRWKYSKRQMWLQEFAKFLGTWFGTLLPVGPWGEAQHVCREQSK